MTEIQTRLDAINQGFQKLVADKSLIDINPFDLDHHQKIGERQKKITEKVFESILDIFRVKEGWAKKTYYDYDMIQVAESLYNLAKKNGSIVQKDVDDFSKYLGTDWLIFTPFVRQRAFGRDNLLEKRHKLGSNTWIIPIVKSGNMTEWIYKNFDKLYTVGKNSKTRLKELYIHQMAQINAGDYDDNVCDGFFLVHRYKGDLLHIQDMDDIGQYFLVLATGLKKIHNNKKEIFFSNDTSEFSPSMSLALNLKNFEMTRIRRHTKNSLDISIDDNALKIFKADQIHKLIEKLLSSTSKDIIWNQLSKSCALLYLYCHGTTFGAQVADASNIVNLCLAGEVLLNLKDTSGKKYLFSRRIALLNNQSDYEKFKLLRTKLLNAYKARSEFLHEGIFRNEIETDELFTIIFTAWLKLAQYYFNRIPNDNDYIRQCLLSKPTHSKILTENI